ncbi:MAG: lytic transglycosylase domain-containing protein, partial [Sphingomonadales bacterium]|nr:lytic transglycosylase domain-containing protein [Sphingomonadales bacterium]
MAGRPGLKRWHGAAATLCAALGCLSAPSPAVANSAAAAYFAGRAEHSAVPALLSESDRSWYKALFAAIRQQDWTTVQAMFDARPDGPLHAVARAEYYLAPGSPRIELDRLNQWLAIGANLPEAESIAALAVKRGATELPLLPQPQILVHLPEPPRRSRPHDIADGTMPATVSAAILEQIKADNPDGAKLLLDGVDATLSADARGEWRQKVAWSYYIENRDADAYALAVNAATGAADPAQPAATP